VAKQAMTESVTSYKDNCSSLPEAVSAVTSSPSPSVQPSLARIPLPLMSGTVEAQYRVQRTEDATMLVWNCDVLKCDEPLQVRPPLPTSQSTVVDHGDLSSVQVTGSGELMCMTSRSEALSALVAAYNDDTEHQ